MKKYKVLRSFDLFDLAKDGACKSGVQELADMMLLEITESISEYLKDDPEMFEALETISDCIPWLIRHKYIREDKDDIFFKIGMRMKRRHSEYILAKSDDYGRLKFINLETGGQKNGGGVVKDCHKITLKEMNNLIGLGSFKEMKDGVIIVNP